MARDDSPESQPETSNQDPKQFFPSLPSGTGQLVAQNKGWGDWDPEDNPALTHGFDTRQEYENFLKQQKEKARGTTKTASFGIG